MATRVGGHRWRILVARVLVEENRICWLCGQPGADTGDHVIPVSVQPELEFVRENVHAAHEHCNKSRGNKPGPQPERIRSLQVW